MQEKTSRDSVISKGFSELFRTIDRYGIRELGYFLRRESPGNIACYASVIAIAASITVPTTPIAFTPIADEFADDIVDLFN